MRATWAIVLLLVGIMDTRSAKQRIISEFNKVECIQFWPELVQLNCELIWQSKSISAINLNFTFTKDVRDLYGEFNLRFQYDNKIINYTSLEMDFCTILQSVHTTRLIQSIAVGLRRVSNLPMKCPFKMNKLYFVNGFIIDPKLIPSYAPEITFISECEVFSNQRHLARIASIGKVGRKYNKIN